VLANARLLVTEIRIFAGGESARGEEQALPMTQLAAAFGSAPALTTDSK